MAWFFGRKDTPLEPNDQGDGDQLNIGPYATGLYEFVRRCDTPMTVGLQGEWGAGKTSLMKLLRGHLHKKDNEDKIVTFWFETWQYGAVGGSDTLGMLLLRDLTDQLLESLKGDESIYRFRDQMGDALRAILPSAAGLATSMLTRDSRAADAVAGAAGALVKGGGRSDLRRCFSELVQKALDAKAGAKPRKADDRHRIVVFIDDLDRVPPNRAVRLLEVLKNFMDVKDCVFVVACDYEVVREGVSELMGLPAEQGTRKHEKVDAFFHKLFQVQFLMPVESYKIDKLLRTYVEERLDQHNETTKFGGKTHATTRKKAIRDFLGTGSSSQSGHSKGLRADHWFEDLVRVVEAGVGTNPRAFKRFLNLVDLTCCVDEAFEAGSGGSGDVRALAHWRLGQPKHDARTLRWCTALFPIVALQQRWPDVAAALLVVAGSLSNPSSAYGDAQFTDFERRLRTIINEWPSTDAADEDSGLVEDKLQDEMFRQQLREILGCDIDQEGAPAAVSDLIAFSERWFNLLNNGADQDLLTAEELHYITQWSNRLASMGTAKVRLTGIARLRRDCMRVDPTAGDGFVALASHLLHWSNTNQLEFVAGNPGNSDVWWRVTVDAHTRTLLVFKLKAKNLSIRINATAASEEKWGLVGLAQAGLRVKEALSSPAVDAAADWHETPQSYVLDFGPRHSAARNEHLRQIFADFLGEVEALARRHRDHLGIEAQGADGLPRQRGPCAETRADITLGGQSVNRDVADGAPGEGGLAHPAS